MQLVLAAQGNVTGGDRNSGDASAAIKKEQHQVARNAQPGGEHAVVVGPRSTRRSQSSAGYGNDDGLRGRGAAKTGA